MTFLLEDIQLSIHEIKTFTEGLTFEMYLADTKTRYAVEQNFTVIGEATSRVTKEYQNLHKHIKWRDLKDFLNIVVLEYFGLDNSIVWNIIQNDLTLLLNDITMLLKKENK